jgi:hypothetical protein
VTNSHFSEFRRNSLRHLHTTTKKSLELYNVPRSSFIFELCAILQVEKDLHPNIFHHTRMIHAPVIDHSLPNQKNYSFIVIEK